MMTNTPQEQPDSQAGDELHNILFCVKGDHAIEMDAGLGIHKHMESDIRAYAERLATERAIEAIEGLMLWTPGPEVQEQGKKLIAELRATLTKERQQLGKESDE